MFGLSSCGTAKYALNLADSGLQSEKKKYAEGESVTVTFDMIATDTDYRFTCDSDDVKLETSYDNSRGYVLTFTMPAHDVTLDVQSRNSMEYDPYAMNSYGPDSYDPDAPLNPLFASPLNAVEQIDNIEDEIVPDNMLFDYCEKTVATDGGDGYDELVLYKYDKGDGIILAYYSRWFDDPETLSACLVSEELYDRCMTLVENYDMANWEKGSANDGKQYVVKFEKDGEFVRVSSDEMPADGMKAFGDISRELWNAWGLYGN